MNELREGRQAEGMKEKKEGNNEGRPSVWLCALMYTNTLAIKSPDPVNYELFSLPAIPVV